MHAAAFPFALNCGCQKRDFVRLVADDEVLHLRERARDKGGPGGEVSRRARRLGDRPRPLGIEGERDADPVGRGDVDRVGDGVAVIDRRRPRRVPEDRDPVLLEPDVLHRVVEGLGDCGRLLRMVVGDAHADVGARGRGEHERGERTRAASALRPLWIRFFTDPRPSGLHDAQDGVQHGSGAEADRIVGRQARLVLRPPSPRPALPRRRARAC